MARGDPEIERLQAQINDLQAEVARLREQPRTPARWAAESRRKIEAGIAAAGDPAEIRRRRRDMGRRGGRGKS